MILEIRDLHVSVDNTPILKGVNLTMEKGKVHALMGPNGSGKSTLAYVLMGHPKYKVDSGSVLLDGKDVLAMKPDERAKAGMFLAFQYPMEIEGVSLSQFLLAAIRSRASGHVSIVDFRKELEEKSAMLGLDKSFLGRSMNVGFSGGEKKRAEVLQMAMLKPAIAILDETDSGLDIDSLKVVAGAVNAMRSTMGALVVTHYQRLLNYLEPDVVHVFMDGHIVTTGGMALVKELEAKGYSGMMKELGYKSEFKIL
jgi:Fe-S cluster assembly ATP-binding protein